MSLQQKRHIPKSVMVPHVICSAMQDMGDFKQLAEMNARPLPSDSRLQAWAVGFEDRTKQIQATFAGPESAGLIPEDSVVGMGCSSGRSVFHISTSNAP